MKKRRISWWEAGDHGVAGPVQWIVVGLFFAASIAAIVMAL